MVAVHQGEVPASVGVEEVDPGWARGESPRSACPRPTRRRPSHTCPAGWGPGPLPSARASRSGGVRQPDSASGDRDPGARAAAEPAGARAPGGVGDPDLERASPRPASRSSARHPGSLVGRVGKRRVAPLPARRHTASSPTCTPVLPSPGGARSLGILVDVAGPYGAGLAQPPSQEIHTRSGDPRRRPPPLEEPEERAAGARGMAAGALDAETRPDVPSPPSGSRNEDSCWLRNRSRRQAAARLVVDVEKAVFAVDVRARLHDRAEDRCPDGGGFTIRAASRPPRGRLSRGRRSSPSPPPSRNPVAGIVALDRRWARLAGERWPHARSRGAGASRQYSSCSTTPRLERDISHRVETGRSCRTSPSRGARRPGTKKSSSLKRMSDVGGRTNGARARLMPTFFAII